MMFTLEVQLGVFILLMLLVGISNVGNGEPARVWAYAWPLASLISLAIIDIIGAAIYLIAGWWQL